MLIRSLPACLLLAFLQAASSAPTPASPAPVAQSAASPSLADSPTPTDPKELLEVGRKVNGLSGPDVQPWHLKASFELFDADGKSKDKGTYEEWWVSEKQYKRVYASTEFSQTEYGTDHGPMLSGNAKWLNGPISLVRQELVQPLPVGDLAYANLEVVDRALGNVKLRCLVIKARVISAPNAPQPEPPSYCFAVEKPILRSTSLFNQVAFNRIQLFRGRYLGGDIAVASRGKDHVKIHADVIEALKQVNMADFQPPADAVAAPPRRVTVSSGLMQGNLITHVNPDYPVGALGRRTQGTVVLQATISKTGHISELKVVSGPPDLQEAAMNAVRQWVYKPYLLNGEPVEVATQINVVFSLGGR